MSLLTTLSSAVGSLFKPKTQPVSLVKQPVQPQQPLVLNSQKQALSQPTTTSTKQPASPYLTQSSFFNAPAIPNATVPKNPITTASNLSKQTSAVPTPVSQPITTQQSIYNQPTSNNTYQPPVTNNYTADQIRASQPYQIPPTAYNQPKQPIVDNTTTAPTQAENPFLKQLQALQTPSTEEQNLTDQKINLEDSYRQGNQQISDKVIPMSFITGQQQSLENRFNNQQIPLQQKLANAQAKRQASIDAVKVGLDQSNADRTYKLQENANAKASLPASAQEYEYAKKNGYTGSFNQYQNEDANRKATASGFTPSQINTTVNQIAGSFDNEPIVKQFNVVNEGYQFAKSLSNATTNPSDDQGLIYAFAKAMDPNSVVREGEYATVQKYSQSLLQSYGKSITQAINGTGFLTPVARENIKKTIEAKYNASKTNYDNVYTNYQKRIEDAKSGKGNGLTDYSSAYGNQGSNIYDF